VLNQPKIACNTINLDNPTPSPLLLSSYRVVPLLTTSRLDFKSEVLERSHQRSQLCFEVCGYSHAFVRRRPVRFLWYRNRSLHNPREIIVKTLEDDGITKSPMKDQWTPSQVLQDHLGTIIDSKGTDSLQLPERLCVMIRRVVRHLLYQTSQNRHLIWSCFFFLSREI
jgi:hypothetical protein